MNSFVEILLSTFNGEEFLKTQLDSILQQDYTYWKLVVRDDGSTDGTLRILQDYVRRYPGKITLITDNEGNLGYNLSFSKLIRESSADYMMFCDQDDYWHPSKISTMLAVMLEEEVKLPGKAHIVFSDLLVTNANLEVTSSSFLKKMHYSPNSGMQIFFLKNYVPGCNLLFNRALVEQVLKTENIIDLHDHWLLMVCSCIGKITFVDKPLMKYRIHERNAIGFFTETGHALSLLSFKVCLKYGLSNKDYRNLLYSKNIQQMQNICERLPELVSTDAIMFSTIDKSNYFTRKLRNMLKPYILERSLSNQLTYTICF